MGVSDPSLRDADNRATGSTVAERILVLLLVLVSLLVVPFCVGVTAASSCGDRTFDNVSGSVVVFSVVDVVVVGDVDDVGGVVVVGGVGGVDDEDADADSGVGGGGGVDDGGVDDGGGVDVDVDEVVVDGVVDVVVDGGVRSVVAVVPRSSRRLRSAASFVLLCSISLLLCSISSSNDNLFSFDAEGGTLFANGGESLDMGDSPGLIAMFISVVKSYGL